MEKTDTKLVWTKEDNAYLNNVFEILNLILAFVIIFAPLLTSFCNLVGVAMDVLNVYLIFFLLYFLVQIFYFAVNIRFFKFKKIELLKILCLCLLVVLIVNFLLVGSSNLQILYAISYFALFDVFFKINKKHHKLLLYSFIATIVICSIMGLCDLSNSFMPGLVSNTFSMSLQFFNPNYSAYITIMAIVLCIYILSKYKTLAEQIVFWTCYAFLNIALFINGCFSAETAMFIAELFLTIYLWIKNKKCPIVVLICFMISIVASFIRIDGYSSSGACYLFESLAVIDGKLGTHLLNGLTGFLGKIFNIPVMDSVIGSDGWTRGELTREALNAIFENPQSTIVGHGAGYNLGNIHVHNVYLHIWVDFGIVALAIYLAILTIMAIKTFKTNFSSHNVFLIALLAVTILVSQTFGCLDPYSFTYFSCLLGIYYKGIFERQNDKKNDKKIEEKINKNESKE